MFQGGDRALQELSNFPIENRIIIKGDMVIFVKRSIILTKIAIHCISVKNYPIFNKKNHHWKAPKGLYHFMQLYKRTVRLLGRIW